MKKIISAAIITMLGFMISWSASAGGMKLETPGSITRSEKRTSLAELRQKYPEVFILHGPTSEKRVALTFDDAPDPRYTGRILDVLKDHQVKATFFIVGWRAERYPELLKRILAEGHEIGNHTYDHPYLPDLNTLAFERQIVKTERVIAQVLGTKTQPQLRLFRPPYGEINEDQLKWAEKHEMTVVNWNVDSLDWKQLDKDQVYKNIVGSVSSGSIILQHAGGGVGQDLSGTIGALPNVIHELKNRGYALVTLPDLLQLIQVYKP